MALSLKRYKVSFRIKAASATRMVPAMYGVVTLDAEEHKVVPPIGYAWIVDVVRSQWYLVMNNVPLPFPVVPHELVVTSFANV